MKVNQPGPSGVQGHEMAKPALQPKGGARKLSGHEPPEKLEGSSGPHRGGAKVEISEKGREFAKVKAAAHDAPDVREEKIAALRKKMAEGTYKVNPDAVADRMVDEHLKTGMD